jgi:hypothetical protein
MNTITNREWLVSWQSATGDGIDRVFAPTAELARRRFKTDSIRIGHYSEIRSVELSAESVVIERYVIAWPDSHVASLRKVYGTSRRWESGAYTVLSRSEWAKLIDVEEPFHNSACSGCYLLVGHERDCQLAERLRLKRMYANVAVEATR